MDRFSDDPVAQTVYIHINIPTTYTLVEKKKSHFQPCTLIWRPDWNFLRNKIIMMFIKGEPIPVSPAMHTYIVCIMIAEKLRLIHGTHNDRIKHCFCNAQISTGCIMIG